MLCCIYMNVAAQRQNTYFITKNGKYVTNADSADIIRIVKENENGSSLYSTNEFYHSGNKKSIGFSSTIDPPTYEGQFISYFENGKRKQLMNYKNGKIIDTVYSYYPNGQLYSVIGYSHLKDSTINYIKTLKDSTGNVLVSDGNGSAIMYDPDFGYINGKGNIKNGEYDGAWSGELRTGDTLTYKETYVNGKMISGESTDRKGNVYHYTQSEVKPTFKGGMAAFFKYIGRTVRYPENMVRNRTQGVARIKFVVFKNGEIGNLQVINQVQPEFANEAMRVIKTAKGWEPGTMKGRKVNVYYVIPINFTLNN